MNLHYNMSKEQTEEICIEAVKQNEFALQYVKRGNTNKFA